MAATENPSRIPSRIQPRSRLLAVPALALSLLTWGCDHATKDAAATALANRPGVSVVPGLELTYVENPDIAFSLLRRLGVPHSSTMLALVSAIALASMVAMLVTKRASLATYAALALMVGGGMGNLADRLTRGRVVDFIHLRGWPVFNVADIAVVAGVVLMALAHLVRRPRPA